MKKQTFVLVVLLAGAAGFGVLGFALSLSGDENVRHFGAALFGVAGLLAIVGAFMSFEFVEKQNSKKPATGGIISITNRIEPNFTEYRFHETFADIVKSQIAKCREPPPIMRIRLPSKPWYLASVNDGLFIIDEPPRPSTDDAWHDRPDGPTLVLNVTDLPLHKAMAIVDAHNAG